MAAPIGNRNAAKGTEVSHAVRRALASNNWERLRRGADRLAEAFADAEPWAWQMVWERMEGKVPQALNLTSGDTRELDLASIVQAVLAARSRTAETLEHSAIPEQSTTLPALVDTRSAEDS